jgi:predicted regulator of Ras-like GTPase activity (Roadblock/LC7/MglB family)
LDLSEITDLSKDERTLKLILERIMNSTIGVKHVILMDNAGITLMSVSKFASNGLEGTVERIGAIGGAVFQAGEEQGDILGYGKIKIQITEYLKGYLIGYKVGEEGILCVVTDSDIQVGIIKMFLEKWEPKIKTLLKRYLSSDQKVASEELKSLFGSEKLDFF